MKKKTIRCPWVISLTLLSFMSQHSAAQESFTTTEYLDINNFNIGHLVHGDMWYDATNFNMACEYPKGSGRHMGGVATNWATASDDMGKTGYAAAQFYRSGGNDFWPGPLDEIGICEYKTSQKWARIWKVSQNDIFAFRELEVRTKSTVPKNILEWPAKGNPYSRGSATYLLIIKEDMAPFVDTDGDGLYDPLKGDYPKIKGDQMLWWIFNDNGATGHAISGGKTMKMEYRVSAYAYRRGGAMDNVVFYEYEMMNKSKTNYVDFRFGMYADTDLGLAFDDYLASVDSFRMGVTYNASFYDDTHLLGFSLVEVPGDVYPDDMQSSGVFTYISGGPSGPRRNPGKPVEFSNYMHGRDADSNLFMDSPMEYPLSRGPIMCDEKYGFIDQRWVLNTSGFSFPANSKRKVSIAMIATKPVGNACGKLNFKELTDAADTAWWVYYNPLPAVLLTGIREVKQEVFRLYPNPAAGELHLEWMSGNHLQADYFKVYDITGRQLHLPVTQNNRQISIDIHSLSPGMYSLVYNDGEEQAAQQFVKQ